MAALDTYITVTVRALLENGLDLSTAEDLLEKKFSLHMPTGTASGQANQIFHDTRTLAGAASESLDFATGGGLTNPFGTAIAMAKIKTIVVKANPANLSAIRVSRPGANGVPFMVAAGDAFDLQPGKTMVLEAPDAGWTVTADTGDLVTFANQDAGADGIYSLIVIGTQ